MKGKMQIKEKKYLKIERRLKMCQRPEMSLCDKCSEMTSKAIPV